MTCVKQEAPNYILQTFPLRSYILHTRTFLRSCPGVQALTLTLCLLKNCAYILLVFFQPQNSSLLMESRQTLLIMQSPRALCSLKYLLRGTLMITQYLIFMTEQEYSISETIIPDFFNLPGSMLTLECLFLSRTNFCQELWSKLIF